MIDEIVKGITELTPRHDHTIIIAISGFGGSGKTTLANDLHEALPKSAIVSIDSFSTHEWRRSADWDNFDRDRFSKQVLQPAHDNIFPLQYEELPWPSQPTGKTVTVESVDYLIVEGCSILHPGLLQYFDYKIWVDCSLDIATERGMWRDRYVFKDEHDELWQTIWMPNEKDFIDKYSPDKSADFLYDGNITSKNLKGKLTHFVSEAKSLNVIYQETQTVKEGVECDIYTFTNDTSKDLAIVRVAQGYKTPLQRILKGTQTTEGYVAGTGTLTIRSVDGQQAVYNFGPDADNVPVAVEVGQIMQWYAESDLTFSEVCEPPYEVGRFEDLKEDA